MEAASLQDLISDTLESMSAQAAVHNLSLQGSLDGEITPVVMDTRRVQRVLYNLVQNSIRHTPPDGTIQIRARDVGAEVQVEVADTGEGIQEEDLPRLFEWSYRTDRSRSRESGGAGLGLSIARGIVEAHGGAHLGRERGWSGEHLQLYATEGAGERRGGRRVGDGSGIAVPFLRRQESRIPAIVPDRPLLPVSRDLCVTPRGTSANALLLSFRT